MIVRRPRSHEGWLAALLTAAVLIFSIAGTNFATWRNLVELVRLAGEIGLLALALTPIIITGGIDLSVGAAMGLVAVVFGLTWRDAGLPVWTAALVATTFTPLLAGLGGIVYAIAAAALGAWLLSVAHRCARAPHEPGPARRLLLATVAYLPALLAALMIAP